MVLTTYVATGVTAAAFGFIFGILSTAVATIRRRIDLDRRETEIAGAEIGLYFGTFDPRERATPDAPRRSGWAGVKSWRHDATAEYHALATEVRRNRDRADAVPVSALILRLRAEQKAQADERRAIINELVEVHA